MLNKKYKHLNFVEYLNFSTWAVKSYFAQTIHSKYPIVKISTVTEERSKKVKLFNYPNDHFGILGVSNNIGMFDAYIEQGQNINQPYKEVCLNDIAYNPYRINVGSIGIKTDDLNNTYISPAYVILSCNISIAPQYLYLLMKSNKFNAQIRESTTGSVRQTLSYEKLSTISIPLAPLPKQKELISDYNKKIQQANEYEEKAKNLEEQIDTVLFDELGVEDYNQKTEKSHYHHLKIIPFKFITLWGVDKNLTTKLFTYTKYSSTSLGQNTNLFKFFARGKSPKYSAHSSKIILNQKCNRWDEILLEHAKQVDEEWLFKVSPELFTQKFDVLINSTGEGTLGRASLIKNEQHVGLLFDSHMLLLRLNMDIILPQLFVYLFNSRLGQKQVEFFKGAEATKQTELGVENSKKIEFPLPPLDIQLQISKKITKMKSDIKEFRQKAQYLCNKAKQDFENEVFNVE